MRFLIDNALSPGLAVLLREAGHEAVHVRDFDMQRAADDVIFEHATSDRSIIVSADNDFGTLLAHALRVETVRDSLSRCR